MTRKSVLTLGVGASLTFATLLMVLNGCRPTCDSVPTEGLASVRILNAVSNSTLLLVYIDGKLFDSCWYDVDNKYAADNPHHVFGDRSTFLLGGAGLRSGLHHVAAMDADSRDTVATWDGVLHNYYQTLIFLGEMNGAPTQTPRVIYLNDITRDTETPSFARFVDAVPDIGGTSAGGLDVYFNSKPKTVAGQASPDLRIHFDRISHNNGLDNGTGLDSNDYLQFPPQVPGLLIMPINDTILNDAILNVPYPLNTGRLLFTIVIRGETEPVGDDPIASTILLEDGIQSQNSFSADIESFAIRMVNASRYPNLSLLIKGSDDAGPRAGIPSGAGQDVLNLGADSVGQYIPLNPTFDESADFWFSKSNNTPDTIFHFFHFDTVNTRTTFIAIDKIPHNTGTPAIDSIILLDTVSNPTNSAMGRVRFVNTSPDYTASFIFAGDTLSMKQRDVRYWDADTGHYSLQVNSSTTISFTLQNETPTTVFFMPSNASNPLPYRISTQ